VDLLIEIGDRALAVRLERTGAGLLVSVDGRCYAVDARPHGEDGLSLLIGEGDGPRTSVDASVAARSDGRFDVRIGERTVVAGVARPFGRRRGAGVSGRETGAEHLRAPMPGKVVRVLVRPGDTVEPRSGLVVVEAMKMENELRASRAGRIGAVLVAEGQSVEAGALLVTVE
jgi:biotin carboxyl carrier protein